MDNFFTACLDSHLNGQSCFEISVIIILIKYLEQHCCNTN